MGIVQTLLLNALTVGGAYSGSRYALRQSAGFPRVLGTAVLGWTWATLGIQILGSLGILRLGPLFGWSGLGLLVGTVAWSMTGRSRSEDQRSEDQDPHAPLSPRFAWDIAALIALVLTLWVIARFAFPSLLGPVKVVSDGPIYHLYFAARWWKAGRLFLIAAPFGESAATYFPAGGDAWFTWLIAGWAGDRLAKVGQAPFLFLAAAAVQAMSRRLGASSAAALIATCWFILCMPLVVYSFEANVDSIFIAGYLTSVYFLMRYGLGDDGQASLALGMLALGCALGTKPTAIVFAPIVSMIAVLVSWRIEKTWRTRLSGLVLIAFLPMIASGFWFARNAILTGNPLYPLQVEAFGRVWLTGWYGRAAMRTSPYFIPIENIRALIDIVLAVLDPRLAPVWIVALLGGWRVGRRARKEDAWVWLIAFVAIANIAFYWVLIPYRTQQRFMLQSVGLAAVPLALLCDRGLPARLIAVFLLFFHVFTSHSWPLGSFPANPAWDLAPEIPNAIPPLLVLFKRERVDWQSIELGVAASTIALAWTFATSRPTWRRIAIAACVTLALVSTVNSFVFGVSARDPRALFFPESFPDYYRGWLALDRASGTQGKRVAYAGTDLPYYLMCSNLKNDVMYININAHRDWLMHDYRRQAGRLGKPAWPDSRPGWDRQPAEAFFRAWLENLRAARVDLVVVTRANPAEGRFNIADREGFPIERRWADEHPDRFEKVYPAAGSDPRFRIYRIR